MSGIHSGLTADVPDMNNGDSETTASDLVRDSEAILEGEAYWVEVSNDEYRGHVGFEKREYPIEEVHEIFLVRDPDGKVVESVDLSNADDLTTGETVAKVEECCLRILRDYYKAL